MSESLAPFLIICTSLDSIGLIWMTLKAAFLLVDELYKLNSDSSRQESEFSKITSFDLCMKYYYLLPAMKCHFKRHPFDAALLQHGWRPIIRALGE